MSAYREPAPSPPPATIVAEADPFPVCAVCGLPVTPLFPQWRKPGMRIRHIDYCDKPGPPRLSFWQWLLGGPT